MVLTGLHRSSNFQINLHRPVDRQGRGQQDPQVLDFQWYAQNHATSDALCCEIALYIGEVPDIGPLEVNKC